VLEGRVLETREQGVLETIDDKACWRGAMIIRRFPAPPLFLGFCFILFASTLSVILVERDCLRLRADTLEARQGTPSDDRRDSTASGGRICESSLGPGPWRHMAGCGP
jgi:hypothetical protein